MANLDFDESRPVNLRLNRKEQTLHIHWADGTISKLDARTLRRSCPCATCRQQRADANPLQVISTSAEPVRLNGANLVGNYALRLAWSDGHDTGIYDFRYLRSLDSAD